VGGGSRFAARTEHGHALVVVNRADVEEEQDAMDGSSKSAGNDGGNDGGTAGERYVGQHPSSAVATANMSSTTPTTAPGDPSNGSGSKQQPLTNVERQPDGTPASGAYVGGDNPEQQLDDMARAAAAGNNVSRHIKTKTRGNDWAIRNANPGMIPIRRTIQVVVRGDALGILPEASATNEDSAAGREFRFGDAPEAAYEDVLSAIDKRIEDWGMAGAGLYWRPVVELKVSPDGEQRYDDLVRLLKNSGAEIRNDNVAQPDEGGARGAAR